MVYLALAISCISLVCCVSIALHFQRFNTELVNEINAHNEEIVKAINSLVCRVDSLYELRTIQKQVDIESMELGDIAEGELITIH